MLSSNNPIPILHLKNLIIQYLPDEHWISAEWIGKQNFHTVTSGCGIMLEALKEYKCQKVFNDNTLVTGTWSEAAEWGAAEWFPQMEQAGLKYFAWVYSLDYYSQMSTDKTLILYKNSVIYTFSNKEAAMKWLREQP